MTEHLVQDTPGSPAGAGQPWRLSQHLLEDALLRLRPEGRHLAEPAVFRAPRPPSTNPSPVFLPLLRAGRLPRSTPACAPPLTPTPACAPPHAAKAEGGAGKADLRGGRGHNGGGVSDLRLGVGYLVWGRAREAENWVPVVAREEFFRTHFKISIW
jgi:hypothetical protein